jgi:hypothetical protein
MQRENGMPGSLQPPDPWDDQDEKEDDDQMYEDLFDGTQWQPQCASPKRRWGQGVLCGEHAKVQKLMEAALSSGDDDVAKAWSDDDDTPTAGDPNGPPRFAACASAPPPALWGWRASSSGDGRASSSAHGTAAQPQAPPSPIGGTDTEEAAEERTDEERMDTAGEITAPPSDPPSRPPAICFVCERRTAAGQPPSKFCRRHKMIVQGIQQHAARNMLPIEGRDFLQGLQVRETCVLMMATWESQGHSVEFW